MVWIHFSWIEILAVRERKTRRGLFWMKRWWRGREKWPWKCLTWWQRGWALSLWWQACAPFVLGENELIGQIQDWSSCRFESGGYRHLPIGTGEVPVPKTSKVFGWELQGAALVCTGEGRHWAPLPAEPQQPRQEHQLHWQFHTFPSADRWNKGEISKGDKAWRLDLSRWSCLSGRRRNNAQGRTFPPDVKLSAGRELLGTTFPASLTGQEIIDALISSEQCSASFGLLQTWRSFAPLPALMPHRFQSPVVPLVLIWEGLSSHLGLS